MEEKLNFSLPEKKDKNSIMAKVLVDIACDSAGFGVGQFIFDCFTTEYTS